MRIISKERMKTSLNENISEESEGIRKCFIFLTNEKTRDVFNDLVHGSKDIENVLPHILQYLLMIIFCNS